MVGSVCWRFYVWLLALLASITGNRHRCLPSLGYSDLSALVEGQVISSWNKQEAIKYPEAVWILAMHMGVSRYGQIILCFCITLWTRQTVAVRGQYTTHCLCTLSNTQSSPTQAGMWALLQQSNKSAQACNVCLVLSLLTIWEVCPLGEAELVAVLCLTGIHRLGISTKTEKRQCHGRFKGDETGIIGCRWC